MLVLIFACLLTIGGLELPVWAWLFAFGVAGTDFFTSDMWRAFWRGLTKT